MKRVLVVLAAILLAFLVGRAPVLHRKITEANEYAAIDVLRAVSHAQSEYASKLNGGYFGDLECLAHPGSCLQVDASDTEPLLDASVALAELNGGYRFLFIPGLGPTRDEWKANVKRDAEHRRQTNLPPLDPGHVPVSYYDYAYIAIPRYPGITGELGFCAAAGGVTYSYLPDELHLLQPRPPTALGPLCPEALSQCRLGPHFCDVDPRPDYGVNISDWPHPKASWLFPKASWREFPKEYVHETILLGLAVPLSVLVLWIKRNLA